jgi:hypothetical protein
MNSKRYLQQFNHVFTCFLILAFSFSFLLPFVAHSNDDNYQLTEIAHLEHKSIPQPNWQKLIANPSNKRQHFAFTENGKIYLIDGDEVNPKAILDMEVKQADALLFKLTAFELHPNFSLRNQNGYGTFYTAHIENINKQSKTKRLQEPSDEFKVGFDAVITEWQFSLVNHQKVDVNTKREVLRIGVPDSSMVIKQLSFNPFIKSWNDNFGLLYVGLNGDKKWGKPLYSGAILRVDPAKFGLRSFRVPENNPYIKNNEIHNAIFLLGGQQIAQFTWPEKSSEHILVSHQYDKQYLLSFTEDLNDWRNATSKQVLYQSNDAVSDMIMYGGSQFPSLRNKLLLLRSKDNLWFLDSLGFNKQVNKEVTDKKTPQLVWPIKSTQLPNKSEISLSRDTSGEPLLLEKSSNILFRLTQQVLINSALEVSTNESKGLEQNSSNNNIFILIFILLLPLLGAIYYWFKLRGHSVKGIVRKQFAAIEISEFGQQVELYHRHQSDAEVSIEIADIDSIEIKLNENSVSLVNGDIGNGFTNSKEEGLRTAFVKEKADKMVDDKVRQVTLLLNAKRNKSYTVCLYLRKGNNRITRKSYTKAVNELIDWCWLLGNKINPEHTEKRTIKPTMLPKEKSETTLAKNHNASLHNQAAAIRPTTNKKANNSKPTVSASNSNITIESEHSVGSVEIESNDVGSKAHLDNTINTELVDALDKLVSLQQQGFLTIDEFSKAKEKLLKDL